MRFHALRIQFLHEFVIQFEEGLKHQTPAMLQHSSLNEHKLVIQPIETETLAHPSSRFVQHIMIARWFCWIGVFPVADILVELVLSFQVVSC